MLHQESRYCLVPAPCTVRVIAGFGSGLIAIPLLALLDFVDSAGHGVRTRDPG